jgi:hypothetical protein
MKPGARATCGEAGSSSRSTRITMIGSCSKSAQHRSQLRPGMRKDVEVMLACKRNRSHDEVSACSSRGTSGALGHSRGNSATRACSFTFLVPPSHPCLTHTSSPAHILWWYAHHVNVHIPSLSSHSYFQLHCHLLSCQDELILSI